MKFTPRFKVGDKVRRKPARQSAPYPYGDAIKEVVRSHHEMIQFADDAIDMNWDQIFFDLVESAGNPLSDAEYKELTDAKLAELGVASGGQKFDAGKSPVTQGALQYFPRALLYVGKVSDYGFKKYGTWGGWRDVPDGFNRYSNGLGRHLLLEGCEDRDVESGLYHAGHLGWNALARLEFKLMRENEWMGE